MTIRIDGTNTAANPGITGADTDTGLQFGTDEVNIVTGGTTRATVDSNGRLGVGTSSPSELLTLRSTGEPKIQIEDADLTNRIGQISQAGGAMVFRSQADTSDGQFVFNGFGGGTDSEYARIDGSGRLLLGTTSSGLSYANIQVVGGAGGASSGNIRLSSTDVTPGSSSDLGGLRFTDGNGNPGAYVIGSRDGGTWTSGSSHPTKLTFHTTPNGSDSIVERMRLASTGVNYVWNNNASTAFIAATGAGNTTTVVIAARRSAGSIDGGTNAYFIYANGTAGSASDVNLKKNIETTRDGYLEDLNRLRVVKYNWNDQEDTEPRELGLIAQEVEEVFPGLACDMSNNDEGGDKTTVKGIKYSVLPVMLLKALQEADAKIEAQAAQLASQAATIAALDARLTALEGGAS